MGFSIFGMARSFRGNPNINGGIRLFRSTRLLGLGWLHIELIIRSSIMLRVIFIFLQSRQRDFNSRVVETLISGIGISLEREINTSLGVIRG